MNIFAGWLRRWVRTVVSSVARICLQAARKLILLARATPLIHFRQVGCVAGTGIGVEDYEDYEALMAQLEDLSDLASLEVAVDGPVRAYDEFLAELGSPNTDES